MNIDKREQELVLARLDECEDRMGAYCLQCEYFDECGDLRRRIRENGENM
jgi:hypothetical protein